MKRFEVHHELSGPRAIVKGEFKTLYPGDEIIVFKGKKEWRAVVETRVEGGATVRLELEN